MIRHVALALSVCVCIVAATAFAAPPEEDATFKGREGGVGVPSIIDAHAAPQQFPEAGFPYPPLPMGDR